MYTYTKQQRLGGIRYGPGALVGNWSEEAELQDSTLKAFLAKRESGTLQTTRLHSRLSLALADVQLTTVRDDGYVHFGDVLQLMHVASGSMLSVDVEDKDPTPGAASCSATASGELTQPLARNTLLLTKYVPPRPTPSDILYPGDVLRYGQKVRLLANPMAQGEALDADGGSRPLALYSRPVSSTSAARYSGAQLVGWTWRAASYDAVWQVQPINPADQAAAMGVEVAAGAPLLLVHCATGQPLHLEGPEVKVPNDFGFEREVTARTATAPGLPCTLESLSQGKVTTGTLPKPQQNSNHWAFLAGSEVAQLPADGAAARAQDKAALIAGLAAQLAPQPGVLEVLRRKLLLLWDKDGQVEEEQALLTLSQVGCTISAAEVQLLQEAMAEEAVAAVAATGAACAPATSSSSGGGIAGTIPPALPRKGYIDARALLQQLTAAVEAAAAAEVAP